MANRRDFLLVSAGRLATALIGLVSVRVVTTVLAPTQYGELSLLIAVQTFCGLCLINPVREHINRHTHHWWDDGTLLSRMRPYRGYLLGVSVIAALATLVIALEHPQLPLLMTAVAMLLMINAVTWNATFIHALNMVGHRSASVIWGTTTGVVGLFASMLLVSYWPTATAWFLGAVIGMSIGAVGAGLVLRQHAKEAKHRKRPLSLLDRRTIVTFCLPLAAAAVLMWLQLSGYRFIVESFWGIELLGYVAVGFMLTSQVWSLVETLVQQFLYPFYFRRITGDDPLRYQGALSDLLNVMGPIYLVLAGMTLLAAPYILRFLAAPQYSSALVFVQLGVAVECSRVLWNLLTNAAHTTKRTVSMTAPYLFGALTVLVLMSLAGWFHVDIVWAGIVLVIAAVLTFGSMVLFMYREIQFVLDSRRWLLGGLAMGVMALPSFWITPAFDWAQVIFMLTVTGVLGGGAMVVLLWNNPAMHRLLSVNLRDGR